MPFVLAFLMLPLAEIAVMILVGGWIGVLPTIALIIAAGVLGMWLIRTQGLRTAAELRTAMQGIGDPARPMANGAIVLLAGLLLIIPGFLTDIAALVLLLPPVRALILRRLAAGRVKGATRTYRGGGVTIIEADYEVIEPKDDAQADDRYTPLSRTRH